MVLVGISCFDDVIVAEIVILGSQVMINFDQNFLSYFNRFYFFLFFVMVLLHDNPKLVEARFI